MTAQCEKCGGPFTLCSCPMPDAPGDEMRAELAVLREEFAKHRRPIYEFAGDPRNVTFDSSMPPTRYLCTKCMRSFAASEETCSWCALQSRLTAAEAALAAIGKIVDLPSEHAPEKIVEQVRGLREKFNGICDRLQDCVQKHHLGLGGEHIDELVVEAVDDYAALIAIVRDVNTSLRLLPLTGIDDPQRIYDTMYKILNRIADWLIDTPDYPGKPAPREICT